jgi:hypothetical protein
MDISIFKINYDESVDLVVTNIIFPVIISLIFPFIIEISIFLIRKLYLKAEKGNLFARFLFRLFYSFIIFVIFFTTIIVFIFFIYRIPVFDIKMFILVSFAASLIMGIFNAIFSSRHKKENNINDTGKFFM